MAGVSHCIECGSQLPENWPKGLCSRCALEEALVADGRAEAGTPYPPLTEKAGDKIGRYKLLQQIGEGGCGVVYMAEQEEPVRRRVALKVIKLGMDTKQVIVRFEAERQALALMDHPNIARVLDAGATEMGRPYFVMELVRGIKITDYCDQNNLSTCERLRLFIEVCHAIQHAHQKGIIHRDIKPSNILVTVNDGVAVPKVIDFGIAKATQGRLTDQTLFTASEQFIGTPAYMSPEQAVMTSLDVDTRSDIYALGVLLYELLTGKTPFDTEELIRAGLDEIRRTIREKEPARPSTRLSTLVEGELTTTAKHRRTDALNLIHLIRGDLDWIVMKCLEKDRTRRYETANGLAMDIARHLKNEPIVARPPTTAYRLHKALRRNKVAYGSAGIVALALVLGTIAATWQAAVATRARKAESRQRQAAELAEKDAETVAQYLIAVFQSPDPARKGRTITVAESLDRAANKLDTDLAEQPAQRARLQRVIGRTYQALGLHQQAIPLLAKVRDYYLSNIGLEHTNTLAAMSDLALSYRESGRLDEALKLREQAFKMYRKVSGPEHPYTLKAMISLGRSYQDAGRRDEAINLQERALGLSRNVNGPEHLDTLNAMNYLAMSYSGAGRHDEAVQLQEYVLGMRRKVLGPEHPDTLATMHNLALSYRAAGRSDEAFKLQEQAIEVFRKVCGPEHPYTLTATRSLAGSYAQQGRWKEAAVEAKKIVDVQPIDHASYHMLAPLFVALGELESYRQLCQKILAQFQGTTNAFVADRMAKDCLMLPASGADWKVVGQLAETAVTVGKSESTLPYFQCTMALAEYRQSRFATAVDWAQKSIDSPSFSANHNCLVQAYMVLSMAHFRLQQNAKAYAAFALGLLAASQMATLESGDIGSGWRDWIIAHALMQEARSLFEGSGQFNGEGKEPLGRHAGHRDEALKLQEEAVELFRTVSGPEHPDTLKVMSSLADSFAQQGRWNEAALNAKRILELQAIDHAPYHVLGPLFVALGDLENYRQLSQKILAQFGGTTNALVADRMAKDCLIHPSSGADWKVVSQLAETAVTVGKSESALPYFQCTMALAEYRQGHFVGAADWAQRSIDNPGFRADHNRFVEAYMVLAMAHFQVQHNNEAKQALANGLEEANKMAKLESGEVGSGWRDWIIAHALMKEAKSLIEGSGPTKGDGKEPLGKPELK